MPHEMLRVVSGSARTSSVITTPEISQRTFLRSHPFQPLPGIITGPDTEVTELPLGQPFSGPSGSQEELQKRRLVLRAWQAQLAYALQSPQEQSTTIVQVLQEQIASSQKTEEAEKVTLSPTLIESVSPEAARRLSGHENTVQAVCSLAKEEAQARGLSLLKIEVRPAWSHEYDERTGVVIDVEIKATADERFSYWDAVCERLSQLEDSLPPVVSTP